MKALEKRTWFIFLSLTMSVGISVVLWRTAGLPFGADNILVTTPFLFCILGIERVVTILLSLMLIKIKPSLGEIA
ncbi:hypothetical protein [Undibacterium sp.]|uniref:hypothetical protein n=1 Tax=Undibacterium sp. TaxID=1914977 RepID=UPI003750D26C